MPATLGRTSGLTLEDRDVSWNIAIKRSIIKVLPKALRELAEPVERALSQVRAVVEHPFHIVKNRFRHKKLRYRGLHKNTAQLHTLVRPGQSGDRQEGAPSPVIGLITPAVCLDPAKAQKKPNPNPELAPKSRAVACQRR